MAINKLKTTSIEVDAITADLLATGSITVADISDGEITAAKLNQSGATDGQAMVWSDSNNQWEPGAASVADTDSLAEGSTNLYYTNARADARAQLKIDALVDTAPSTLDTLNELAAALGDDANFSTTITNSIATKIGNVAEDTTPQLGGNLDVNGKDIVSSSNGDIEIKPNGSGDIHLETTTGMLRINHPSGGAGIDLGSHNMYLNSDSTTTGTSVSIGMHPGTDESPSVSSYSFLRTTRTSNTSGEFSIHVANETSPAGTYYVTTFGGAADKGKVDFSSSIGTKAIIEKAEPSNSTTGTIDFNFLDQAIINFLQDQTAARTINFRGDGSTTLASMLSTNQSVTCSILMPQGSTPYFINAVHIDGTASWAGVLKWQGGSAPTAGNASGIDVYSFTIIKTPSSTFTVLASVAQYA